MFARVSALDRHWKDRHRGQLEGVEAAPENRTNHVLRERGMEVGAHPDKKAKELLADRHKQMGYRAESGSWRSIYLQGGSELRKGVPDLGGINPASPDTIKAMPPASYSTTSASGSTA